MSFSSASKKNGKTYYLHSRQQTLRGGATVTLLLLRFRPWRRRHRCPSGRLCRH